MIFSPALAFFLFPGMLVALWLGKRLRQNHKVPAESAAIEGAVFALFGLLLAFTFSGAVTRFDDHRRLVTEEANDIGTAYLRLDLIPQASQPALRQLFRDYVTSRLHLYDRVSNEISPEARRLQSEIWRQSLVAAASPGANVDATKLLLPSLNTMIDITSTRQTSFNLHPPIVVFYLLFALSLLCALMAGYGMKVRPGGWLHIVILALTVTLTIYATLEIEFPRQGLLRLKNTDKVLIDLRDSM